MDPARGSYLFFIGHVGTLPHVLLCMGQGSGSFLFSRSMFVLQWSNVFSNFSQSFANAFCVSTEREPYGIHLE